MTRNERLDQMIREAMTIQAKLADIKAANSLQIAGAAHEKRELADLQKHLESGSSPE